MENLYENCLFLNEDLKHKAVGLLISPDYAHISDFGRFETKMRQAQSISELESVKKQLDEYNNFQKSHYKRQQAKYKGSFNKAAYDNSLEFLNKYYERTLKVYEKEKLRLKK